MAYRWALAAALVAVGHLGCTSNVEPPDAWVEPLPDAGPEDAGADARLEDAATVDSARIDGGAPDAGALPDAPDAPPLDPPDAPEHDGGLDAEAPLDAGTDAGTDAGSDAGTDAGTDAAREDAGPGPTVLSSVCLDGRSTYFRDVHVAPDGTTTVAGYYEDVRAGDPTEGLVVQLAPSGAVRWQHRLGGAADDSFLEVLPVAGGVVAIGNTRSHASVGQAWVVRFDTDGHVVSERVFGDTQTVEIRSAIGTSDGGVLLLGRILLRTTVDLWVAKLDAALLPEWQITGGTTRTEDAVSGAQLSDGYLLVGRTPTPATSDDVWLLRLDLSGTVVSQARYHFLNADRVWAVVPTASGTYLVGDTNRHAWLTHIQPDGSVDWSRTFDHTLVGEEVLIDALAVGDDVLVAGDTNGPSSWYDLFLLRVTPAGDVVWSRSVGGAQADRAEAIARHPDGSFVVTGWTSSFGGAEPGSWLTRVTADGAVDVDCLLPSTLATEDRVVAPVVTTATFSSTPVATALVTSALAPSGVVCAPSRCATP